VDVAALQAEVTQTHEAIAAAEAAHYMVVLAANVLPRKLLWHGMAQPSAS
jgi:hypothetical protein